MNYQLLQSQTVTSSNVSTVAPIFNVNMGTLGNTQSAGTLWTITTQFSSKFKTFATQEKHRDDIGNTRPSCKTPSLHSSLTFQPFIIKYRII